MIEQAIETDTIFSTPTPVPAGDATWLEVKEMEVIVQKKCQIFINES